MKSTFLNQLLVIAILSLGGILASTQSTLAQSRSYNCSEYQGSVAIFLRTTHRGNVPFIVWNERLSSQLGDRCREIADRFQRADDNGTINFMTTGIVNNLPVICVAGFNGGPCLPNGTLMTLRANTNSQAILDRIKNRQLPVILGDSDNLPSANRFNFPMDTCGDTHRNASTWYPVYVNYSESNLRLIRSQYCRDAIRNRREGSKLHSIQVASFIDREDAIRFAELMKEKVGSGEVGLPSRR